MHALNLRLTLILTSLLLTTALLRAEEVTFTLDISKFDKPNSSADGWVESGIGTAALTYTHETGVQVIFRPASENSGVIVRTYLDGIGALGIDDPTIDFKELLSVEIRGISGTASMSSFSFVGLLKSESVRVMAPGLVFFQQNHGKIAGGIKTNISHDDERGQTRVVGLTDETSHISVVEFLGADDRPGFSLSSEHDCKFRTLPATANCAFAGMVFVAEPE